MDGFADAFGNVEDGVIGGGSGDGEIEMDPAAEFLAREQSNLAGLDDFGEPNVNVIEPEDQPLPIPIPIPTDNNNPTIVTNGIAENRRSPSPLPIIPREEPEKIKRWREEQKARLQKKDEEEEKKKKEMREAAKKELEEWYSTHDEQVAKNRNANRSAERELVADTEPMEPGTEWERIAKLCDFNPKGSKHQKDISRMRSIILQVKQTPPVPSITTSRK